MGANAWMADSPVADAAARGDLVESAMGAMEELTLVMAQTSTFARAGMIDGHHLRSLDAIHIATAQGIDCVDIFVTYDDRQAAEQNTLELREAVAPTLAPAIG